MLMLLLLTIVSLLVTLLLLVVKLAISDASVSTFGREEASSYECGFEQYSLSRVPLSIRYFMLTLVFLIFDLEVMLLMFSPVDFILVTSKSFMILVSLTFILLLFLGLIFEWYDGSLEWIM